MMQFSRENWRKLYVRENLDHKAWPVLWRGIRDYLIRVARDDGTLLAATTDPGADMARALGSHADESASVAAAVGAMIQDGFLSHKRSRLFISRFEEAQERATSTKRVRAHRERKLTELCETETFQASVTKREDETETTRNETTRNETKRRGRQQQPIGSRTEVDPRVERLSVEILKYKQFAIFSTTGERLEFSEALLGVIDSSGVKFDDALAAVPQCASDVDPGMSPLVIRRKLRAFFQHAKPRSELEHNARKSGERQGYRADYERRREEAHTKRHERDRAQAATPEQAKTALRGFLERVQQ